MMAMCTAFGDTPGVNMQIIIGQFVNLVTSFATNTDAYDIVIYPSN